MKHHLAHYVVSVIVGLTTFLICLVSLLLYFAPTFYAFYRNAEHRWAIFVVNLLTGWTLVGWFAAAFWARSDRSLPSYPHRR